MMDPVLFVVDDDSQELAACEHALRRRFGVDYRIVAERSPERGLDLLERLARAGEDVALVAADLKLPGIDGVEVLERAHALHSGAVRALLVEMDEYHTRIPFSELETLQRATSLGRAGCPAPGQVRYPRHTPREGRLAGDRYV